MREIILDVPIEKQSKEPLFDYDSLRVKPAQEYHSRKSKIIFKFTHNIQTSKPLYSSSNAKQVVIKNIGSMKKSHLKNALAYTLRNASEPFAINNLSERVSLNEIWSDWKKDFNTKKDMNEALHLVFSLNEIKSSQIMNILECATRDTLAANVAEYKWVMIPHSHQKRPHIHIIINKTNIFTGKKLHFKGKSIREFFERMKEDFKHNLLLYSQGRLNYVNEPCNKDFRKELIESRLEQLESIKIQDEALQYALDSNDTSMLDSSTESKESLSVDSSKDAAKNFMLSSLDLAKDFSFFNDSYKNMISALDARHKDCVNVGENLRNELKNTSIYLHNVSKKIKALEASNKNPTNLLEKQALLRKNVLDLKQKRAKNKKELESIKTSLKHFLDWQDKFKDFTKHFDDFNKKKTLLNSFKGFSKYVPLDLSKKLVGLKAEVQNSELLLQKGLPSFSAAFIAALSHQHSKQNTYTLSKNLYSIYKYKSILRSLSFDFPRDNDNKAKNLAELEAIESNLKEQLKYRFNFLQECVAKSKKQIKQYALANNIDSTPSMLDDSTRLQAYKDYLKILRQLNYLERELLVCAKSPVKHKIVKSKPKLESHNADAKILQGLQEQRDSAHNQKDSMQGHTTYLDSNKSNISSLDSHQLLPESNTNQQSPKSSKQHSTKSIHNIKR